MPEHIFYIKIYYPCPIHGLRGLGNDRSTALVNNIVTCHRCRLSCVKEFCFALIWNSANLCQRQQQQVVESEWERKKTLRERESGQMFRERERKWERKKAIDSWRMDPLLKRARNKVGRGGQIDSETTREMGRGWSTVGTLVASNSRDPRFESSHLPFYLVSTMLQRQKIRERGREWTI